MSKLIKDIEPAAGQDGLARLLQEAQGLERGSRKARLSAGAYSEPPEPPGSPESPRQRNQQLASAATPVRSISKEGIFAEASPKPNFQSLVGPPPSLILKLKVPSLFQSQAHSQNKASTANHPAATPNNPSESPSMASQRNRPGRGGPRGATNDLTEEKDLWQQILPLLSSMSKAEARAAEVNKEIFENEVQKKEKANAGIKPSIEDIEALSLLYREQIRTADDQKARATDEDLISKITLLMAMIKHNEDNVDAQPPARVGSSRTTAMDFDGPSDSPMPSPAENKQVRKIGPSRTSSQPPRSSADARQDTAPSEASERASKPKVVYAQGEEVAFKRKIPGRPDEQDWILGKVQRVIGEGKSRRYDVQDPYPDEGTISTMYKSSASQMVPIPAEGTLLEDYEVGKRVLALYPDTTTFYRAEVKAMLEDGKVQLLFEDEAAGALKIVDRRFVLDHKG